MKIYFDSFLIKGDRFMKPKFQMSEIKLILLIKDYKVRFKSNPNNFKVNRL